MLLEPNGLASEEQSIAPAYDCQQDDNSVHEASKTVEHGEFAGSKCCQHVLHAGIREDFGILLIKLNALLENPLSLVLVLFLLRIGQEVHEQHVLEMRRRRHK